MTLGDLLNLLLSGFFSRVTTVGSDKNTDSIISGRAQSKCISSCEFSYP